MEELTNIIENKAAAEWIQIDNFKNHANKKVLLFLSRGFETMEFYVFIDMKISTVMKVLKMTIDFNPYSHLEIA